MQKIWVIDRAGEGMNSLPRTPGSLLAVESRPRRSAPTQLYAHRLVGNPTGHHEDECALPSSSSRARLARLRLSVMLFTVGSSTVESNRVLASCTWPRVLRMIRSCPRLPTSLGVISDWPSHKEARNRGVLTAIRRITIATLLLHDTFRRHSLDYLQRYSIFAPSQMCIYL